MTSGRLSGLWDTQYLSDTDMITIDFIGGAEISQANLVLTCDSAQGITTNNDMFTRFMMGQQRTQWRIILEIGAYTPHQAAANFF